MENHILSKYLMYSIQNNIVFNYDDLKKARKNFHEGVLLKTICFYGNLDMLKIFFEYNKFSRKVIYDAVTITATYDKIDLLKYLLANIPDIYSYSFDDAIKFCLVEGIEQALKLLIPLSDIDFLETKVYNLIKKNNNERLLSLF